MGNAPSKSAKSKGKQPLLPSDSNSYGTGGDDNEAAKPGNLDRDICGKHASYFLYVCCFAVGLCDSTAYKLWGCFLAMQTGNAIIIAVGVGGGLSDHWFEKPIDYYQALASITSFCIGARWFSNWKKPTSRGRFGMSFLNQSLFIVAAAINLLCQGKNPRRHDNESSLRVFFRLESVPIYALAAQAGGLMATMLELEIPKYQAYGLQQISTSVITTVLADISRDKFLFRSHNYARDRRLKGLLILVTGGIAGGCIINLCERGAIVNLFVAALIKFAIALAFFFLKWTGEGSEEED